MTKNKHKEKLFALIDGLRNQKKQMSYPEIFLNLKNQNLLPKKWTNHESLQKFYRRNMKTHDNKYHIRNLMKPILDAVTIDEKARFKIFWDNNSSEEKKLFINWIAIYYHKIGIPIDSISALISNEFMKLGWLNDHTIHKYIPQDFKNSTKIRLKEPKK